MVGLSVVLEGQKGHLIGGSSNNNNTIANNTTTDQELELNHHTNKAMVFHHHANIILSSSFPISPKNYNNPWSSPPTEIGASAARSPFPERGNEQFSYFHPPLAFLDRCFLCKAKLLPGRDIYMYKGDRGFCSVECRSSHISLDEQSDKQKNKNTR